MGFSIFELHNNQMNLMSVTSRLTPTQMGTAYGIMTSHALVDKYLNSFHNALYNKQMSQASLQTLESTHIPQHSETPSKSFNIPDGPPQPHPREEISPLQHSTPNDSDHKPAIGPDEEVSDEQARELGLPEQRHAGKVGYGPEIVNMHHVVCLKKLPQTSFKYN